MRIDKSRGRLRIFKDLDSAARGLGDHIRDLAESAVSAKGRFDLVAMGGSLPHRVYEILAESPFQTDLPWDRIHLFSSDERCVPAEHEASRYGLVNRLLISQVSIPAPNIHRMSGSLGPAQGARAYHEMLSSFYENQAPAFDLAVLGLEPDGRLGALLPGSDLDQTWGTWAVAAEAPEGEVLDFEGMTLTLSAINQARFVVIFLSGEHMAPIFRDIWTEDSEDGMSPASRVRPAGELFWFLDQAAASAAF